mmetsp:Transcript_14260/g.43796  ORF Transcript_14260/g.43796 Transcript_14260/m.43796 type:complete len:244 (+) Transcript_14260:604-1335(+)
MYPGPGDTHWPWRIADGAQNVCVVCLDIISVAHVLCDVGHGVKDVERHGSTFQLPEKGLHVAPALLEGGRLAFRRRRAGCRLILGGDLLFPHFDESLEVPAYNLLGRCRRERCLHLLAAVFILLSSLRLGLLSTARLGVVELLLGAAALIEELRLIEHLPALQLNVFILRRQCVEYRLVAREPLLFSFSEERDRLTQLAKQPLHLDRGDVDGDGGGGGGDGRHHRALPLGAPLPFSLPFSQGS